MDFEPKICRTLVFVRHGQYSKNPEQLSELGREQAALAGEALKDFGPEWLLASDMPRAIETAEIVGARIGLSPKNSAEFREGVLPGMPRGGFPVKRFATDKKRAEKAWKQLTKKPVRSECWAIVAHGNVIRYWACKALGIDPKKWVKMDVLQGSITVITVSDKGKTMLMAFNSAGHIPKAKQTFL